MAVVELCGSDFAGNLTGRRPNTGNLPRVWWMGAGIASYLPFHAAGIHTLGSSDNTLCWAVSSYAPTIIALTYAREGRTTATVTLDPPKPLVVTMPRTPGKRDLPGVENEKAAIEMVAQSTFPTETLNQPDAKMVLERLIQCDMLHFAGRGVADYTDPFNSSLLLQKGHGAAATVDNLSVREVFNLHLKGARIAYLSACSTAETWAIRLLDEVIHLASGFQIAGFSHVIASMWPTDDDACAEMATGFYGQLKDKIERGIENRDVAVAAHQSVMEMRSKWLRYPLLWAPYIHLGA
ncbi:hypothetical protein PENSUB_4502 [Penicillium subrubescens]|uniref:CHAT domain-containing protein n=1 Tax=Penicillium subrubescens TaxID=1316194 RepID=A0A1Q5UC38_9EURO|nr:hypothetical protein PENSUB_4502 [Penicillium subrubescens]